MRDLADSLHSKALQFSDDVKTKQCTIAANKARTVLFAIRRAFDEITPDISQYLYAALVRSHLEYAL